MSLLSKSEIQYLQGQKQVSKSYGYKLKSVIKKKVANLRDNEIPLLSKLFPNPNLTEISKEASPLKATIPGSNPGRSIWNCAIGFSSPVCCLHLFQQQKCQNNRWTILFVIIQVAGFKT